MMKRPVQAISRRGLTLLELLLAISITVMLGAAVASVLTAASRSMTATRNSQSALQRAHALQSRVRAYSDSALCLLDYKASEGIVMWLEDSDASGDISLGEVRVFWFDTAAQAVTVERAEFPSDFDEATRALYDIPLTPEADFFTEMESLRALGYTRAERLADGVGEASLSWDGLVLREQPRAVFRVRLQIDDESPQETIACLGMPNHTEPR